MASVDLKDAYCSVPVASLSLKLVKFSWKGKLYQYTCLPNGLSSCPRKFTKLLKPVYSTSQKRDTSHQVILITPTRIVPVMLSTQ